jgi:putative chitinase
LTGKANYKAFSDYLKNPLVMEQPDLVAGELAFESAKFFFDKNKLWDICDKGVTKETILALTKRINGGTHGLADREEKSFKYYALLK